jgi:lysyl-tRNA synthetase class 2
MAAEISRATRIRERVPRIYSIVLTLVGLFCAIEALIAPFRRVARPVRDVISNVFVPADGNLAYAVFILILAAAIARRKRIAWRLLIFFLGLQLLFQLLAIAFVAFAPSQLTTDSGKPIDRGSTALLVGIEIVVSGLLLGSLIWARREFYAPVARASFRRAVGITVALLGVAILIGWGLVAAFPGTLHGPLGTRLAYSASRVLGGAFRFTSPDQGHTSAWVNLLLGLLGAIAVLTGFATLLGSQRAEARLPADQEQQIRGLLGKYGSRDSLGYFATRRDKSAVFSPSGKAAITYRVVNGVCLASGDPIGDVEAWTPAIDAWQEINRRYAWVPAVMGASEDGAIAYQRAGLGVLELGDEAILHVDTFTLEGRDMRPVRQAVNRLERAGYTTAVTRHADLPEAEMAEVVAAANSWRDTDSERGFSMALGRLGDPADGQCVLVEAYDGSHRRTALLSLSPWGPTGLSLDLMRRDHQAENGVMELMVAALMRECPRLGVQRISLNFAVFRSVFQEGARIGAGPILRMWRHLLLFFSRWWQLESLYRSNMKYHPEWVPRFLCYGERRELVKIGMASAIAEGFLNWPPWSHHGEAITTGTATALLAPEPAALPIADEPPKPKDQRPEQERVRRTKLSALRERGIEPYPVTFARTDDCGTIARTHAALAPDSQTGVHAAVAGRVMLIRDHGERVFAVLRDWTGDLQVMLDPTADVEGFTRQVDIGDHVGVQGEVITTKTGEVTVAASSWTLTAKCLHPLPDKHRGLSDPEARVRRRYLDLITNPATRDTLRKRSAAIHSLRHQLHGRGFIELETPILQRIHGGANARPFRTHINAYDLDLYLRIAPELFLKRLAIGGVEKVFELGRTFRNEGVSFKHNPEFTMLEAYQAYGDYMTMLDLTRELIQNAAIEATGEAVVRWPAADGSMTEVDISGQWPVRTINESVSSALGVEVTADTGIEDLRKLADAASIAWDPGWSRGAVLLEIYEHLVEHVTTAPTFYKDFPTDESPLTREHRDDPRLAEKWDLVAFGTELGTAYSELIDPIEQRKRLTEQSLLAAGGDPEAMELDEDFLTALEYAMPPTGGLGIGVDRLIMLLTGQSIRETLPFPMVRPTSS